MCFPGKEYVQLLPRESGVAYLISNMPHMVRATGHLVDAVISSFAGRTGERGPLTSTGGADSFKTLRLDGREHSSLPTLLLKD